MTMSYPTQQLLMRRRVLIGAAGGLLLEAIGTAGAAAAVAPPGSRTALVVGIDAYSGSTYSKLTNAVNDARLIGQTCEVAGFKPTVLENPPLDKLIKDTDDWLRINKSASVRFFYFAGHGSQYRGVNFLIAADSRPRSEDDLQREAYALSTLIDSAASLPHGATVIVIDACRTAPPTSTGKRDFALPSSGLAAVDHLPRGVIVAFSTSPGGVAFDNPMAGHGVYAPRLAKNLSIPALNIEDALIGTRKDVVRDTHDKQRPWNDQDSLLGRVCFTEKATLECGSARLD